VTRYVLDKVMRLVNMNPPSLAAYRSDAEAFVTGYLSDHPADAAALTGEERDALAQRDYGSLYRLGAHPYLLWSFTEAVWVPEVSRAELVESFRTQAAAAGYPDWATTPEPGRASGTKGVSADRVEGAYG
jgi:hypothetical protein